MRARYGRLLDDAVTRWDVNFVLGEFIGELNASHTYRGGGDVESGPTARRRDARRRLGAGERRLPHQADPRRRAVGRRRALAARRARHQGEGGRLRARRQRRAARHHAGSRGPRSRASRANDGRAHRQRASRRSTARGRCWSRRSPTRARLRYLAWIEATAASVDEGDRRARRLHLRARAPASTRRTSWCGSSWRSGQGRR